MRTIEWDEEREAVRLIDQTRLPRAYKIEVCERVEELIRAIKELKVRGAPALGVAGALGVVLACKNAATDEAIDIEIAIEKAVKQLQNARPTAVNLSYGVNRAFNAAKRGETPEEMKNTLLRRRSGLLMRISQ